MYEKNGDITLKIADFGLAMKVTSPIFTICGTPTYVAPEILSEEGYGLEVDVWAAGVILYIMLCGFPPFRSANRKQTELFDLIEKCEYEFLEPYWEDVSKNAKDLISKILVADKGARLSAKQVFGHPWLTQFGLNRNDTLYSIVSPKRSNRFKTTARSVQSIERMKMILKLERERFITHVHHEEDDAKNDDGGKQLTVLSEKLVASRENTSDSQKSGDGERDENTLEEAKSYENSNQDADESRDAPMKEESEQLEATSEKAPNELTETDEDEPKDDETISDSSSLLDTNDSEQAKSEEIEVDAGEESKNEPVVSRGNTDTVIETVNNDNEALNDSDENTSGISEHSSDKDKDTGDVAENVNNEDENTSDIEENASDTAKNISDDDENASEIEEKEGEKDEGTNNTAENFPDKEDVSDNDKVSSEPEGK